jgi:hypothetical protein
MEEGSIKREAMPRLLDLIHDEKQWNMRGAPAVPSRPRNTGFGGDEDKKLELKLGLPGLVEEEKAATSSKNMIHQESPALSLGHLPTTTTGAKRGFLDTVEAKPQGNKAAFQFSCSWSWDMLTDRTSELKNTLLFCRFKVVIRNRSSREEQHVGRN